MHRRSIHTLLLLATAALAPSTVVAQQSILAPPAARISDGVIQDDHRTYEALQGRIRAVNATGRPLRDYHLSKAQCWLDASFHEYTRNDRSAFPQEALDESAKLVVGMEHDQRPLPMETPLVNHATRLRPDLWSRTSMLEGGRGFRCAAQKVACAEVELVHAGNEYDQQGWRHAAPYVQIAEDLLAEADALAERCEPAPPATTSPTATPIAVEERLVAQIVFRFGGGELRDILPASLEQLEAIVTKATSGGTTVRSIRLVGHADRLNGTGVADYNDRLSAQRSATVGEFLIAHGIAPRLIEASSEGDRRQIESCDRPFGARSELEACLLPNRRVELQVTTTR